jgi:hypothetical protein
VHHEHHTAQAYASHQLEEYCTFKTMSCQKPQICEISKGVSEPILKFLHKVILRTRNYGTLSLAFLLLLMVDWKSPLTWPHAANHDDLVVSIPFPANQVEALDVEILLSSQGSRIVNVEKSSIVYSFLVRAHNLQILRIEQGSTPRIDRSFLLRFSLLLSQT